MSEPISNTENRFATCKIREDKLLAQLQQLCPLETQRQHLRYHLR